MEDLSASGAVPVWSGSPVPDSFGLLGSFTGLELLLGHREAVSSDCLIGAVNARVSLLVSMKSTQMPREEHLFLTATWLGGVLH